MMRAQELAGDIAILSVADLLRWIAADLVAPIRSRGDFMFSDRECARVRLICALRWDMEVDEQSLPVVLSLLDQLYAARAETAVLADAVARQSPAVQAAIAAAASGGPKVGRAAIPAFPATGR